MWGLVWDWCWGCGVCGGGVVFVLRVDCVCVECLGLLNWERVFGGGFWRGGVVLFLSLIFLFLILWRFRVGYFFGNNIVIFLFYMWEIEEGNFYLI